ncbi:hotdog domain-containing protein [Mycobacterium sp. 1274756.6]|uniref:hotdog domain-containing protein n=1 Tax=Mycobacterium sp. 1274756.6 TaxID=1834076 RepID=UPI0007FE85E5|nr:hotdog domain-containing protein [Mycobacterium sp. 1274756.6]OBJ73381.1 thioesterase [Mycobacterium sp. 1274756.6]
MEFPFDAIAADELDRLQALHNPLTQAIRELIDTAIHTDADEATVRDAQAAIEAVNRALGRTRRNGTRTLRQAETGLPVAWGNPVVGTRNPIAPPVLIHHEGGHCWSEFDLGVAYEGPPGWVHGGICALILDHVLGEAVSEGLNKPYFTGTLTCRYRRGTPLGRVRVDADIERTEGIKAFARGTLSDAEGITVEAEGVFVMPAWAREAR